jgi:hypothetical protein
MGKPVFTNTRLILAKVFSLLKNISFTSKYFYAQVNNNGSAGWVTMVLLL